MHLPEVQKCEMQDHQIKELFTIAYLITVYSCQFAHVQVHTQAGVALLCTILAQFEFLLYVYLFILCSYDAS